MTLYSQTYLLKYKKIYIFRWPSNRFTKNLQTERDFESTCQSKSTCNVIDATIWVAPLCAAGSQSTVCVETFKDAACYPYCMAARYFFFLIYSHRFNH
jgi:hypothetical protein